MVGAALELIVGVVAITGAGLLLLQAWDRQNAQNRARRRTRKP